MRTLESLVKKSDGWSKIKKIPAYEKLNLSLIKNTKVNDIHINDKNIKDLLDAFSALNYAVLDAYESNIKYKEENKKEFSASSLPLCVVIAAINNSTTQCSKIKSFSTKEFLNCIKDATRKMKHDGDKQLDYYMSCDALATTDFFCWFDSPEGEFWETLYIAIKDRNEQYAVQYGGGTGMRAFKTKKTYKEFIDAHPECEEEIMKFCKKGGN